MVPSSLIITLIITATELCMAITSAALIPQSPNQQIRRAISSIRDAISSTKQKNERASSQQNSPPIPLRFYVDYLIPLPPETKAEDIDPWPGGLAQMYPYAEDIVTDILRGVVSDPTDAGPTSQVVSAPDCCGLFIQESSTSPSEDVAALVFPGVDQLSVMEQVDAMVGNTRPLILLNRQFTRPVDFGLNPLRQKEATKTVFDRYQWAFAFQEFACRGEDTKLVFEYDKGWQSCIICDAEGEQELQVLEPQRERPEYKVLEDKINEILPEPLWMRKMQEAKVKGFKFQREE